MNRKQSLTLAALAMPLLLSVGCKSTECGCGSHSDSWTSWSPISWKTSEHVVSGCAPCESSASSGKSTSGKVTESYTPSNKVNKIVVPEDKPRPLPGGQP